MHVRTRGALCLVTLAAAAAIAAGPATQPAAPAVGDKAADFSLDTIDGKTVRLSELEKAGPVVLIELRGWVGYQCPICTRQVHAFVAQADAFKKAGAQVVLVYPGAGDGLKEHAADFVRGTGLPENFLFVLDPGLKFVSDYHLRWVAPKENDYPATFVVDRDGTVRFATVSHTHGGRATPPQVLAALAALH